MSKRNKHIEKIANHMANEIFRELSENLNAECSRKNDPDVRTVALAESSAHVLRGLISYHERMTMGNYPERDFYLDALRFALACVEGKIK